MRQSDLARPKLFEPHDSGSQTGQVPLRAGLLAADVAASKAAAIAALLPEFGLLRRLPAASPEGLSGVVVWRGWRKRGAARRLAKALNIPFIDLGCSLFRAPPGWGAGSPILSATAQLMRGPPSTADFLDPSRLLATEGWESPDLLARAAKLRRDVVARRTGGEWWYAEVGTALLPRRDGPMALLVADEQCAREAVLCAMLTAALAENPPDMVTLLAPPQRQQLRPIARLLSDAAARGCTVLTGPVDRWEAVERAGCVYAAGGETGFLAALAGVKVRSFADSFYSGWGITVDDTGVARKPFRRTIDEIFAGTCLLATRYRDPYRNRAASFEDIAEIVAEWRKIELVNRSIAACLGMSFWKRRRVADFLRSAAGAPAFRRTARAALAKAAARPGSAVAVWASRAPPTLFAAAERRGIPLLRIEDGFVRSVGLGSDFLPPASLVLDRRGMHFDPTVRSDLESVLLETEFDCRLLERARNLVSRLVAGGVTKYNLGSGALSIAWPAGKPRILVPGQVEDDLSVRLGGAGVRGNLELLGRIRAANPGAFILYKPHPDVEAGHRKGKVPDEAARRFADIVVRDVSTAALLAEVDELHTLTSLAGFEALLRKRRVVVYGQPFYAGWGLTADLSGVERGRKLTLEELVAGALILYPRYVDPLTRLPCGPEVIIERLSVPELWRPGVIVAARRLQGLIARRRIELSLWVTGMLGATRDNFRTPRA